MQAKHIIGGALIAICLAVGVYSLRSSLTPYVSFEEAKKSGRTVQIAGALVPDTTVFDGETGKYKFTISDDKGAQLKIETMENLPANFEQSTTVVAIGEYKDPVFDAGRVLVKCPSKYEGEDTPPPGEHPDNIPRQEVSQPR